MQRVSLDIIVPVYNEEDCLPELLQRIDEVRRHVMGWMDVYVIAVDDGSTDSSREVVRAAREQHPWISGINLTRNFGHQIAVSAGMDMSKSDYVAIIDADLQDPPELIPEMVQKLMHEQVEIVYGTRISRDGETRSKQVAAKIFYRILKGASGLDIPLDTGDFRVMTKKANSQIASLREHNRFLRGLAAWTGLNASPYWYSRDRRFAGKSKYTFGRMISLAFNGLVSFSPLPLRLMQLVGVLIFAVGISIPVMLFIVNIWMSVPLVEGILVALSVVNIGVVLGAIGIVGGYVHRIQDEVRGRPLYLKES